MDKSTVTKYVERIDRRYRPNGFIQINMRRRQKLFIFHGCVELRFGDHSTSFYYSIFNYNHSARTYEFCLYLDEDRACCFLSAMISFINESPLCITYEVVETSGQWSEYKDEAVKLFHLIAHEYIYETKWPKNPDGSFFTQWLQLFNKKTRYLIKEHLFVEISDVVNTTNRLLM